MSHRLKKELIYRALAIASVLTLITLQFILTSPHGKPHTEWMTFTSILYTLFILLASIGFGVLGTFIGSTLSIVFTSLIYFRAHLANPSSWIITFSSLAIVLYIYMTRFQKQAVAKRITLHDLEAQWNDSSQKYSKDKGIVRSYKNKITRYSTLRQLGEKLISTLFLDETAKKTLEVTAELIGKGDQSCLFLLDENLKNFTLTHQIHLTDKGKEFLADPGDSFNLWIMKNRQNLLIEDLHIDFRFKETAKGSPIASLISAPLVTENKLIGAIRIESHEPRTFQLENLRILATLANVASTSLKNARLYSETLELSIKDGLTGLYVSTHFHQEFQRAFAHAQQNGSGLSVLMADIDDFKKVNDRFGHTVGDSILKKISEIFRQTVDAVYVPTRYGGEEFSALFPGWDLKKTQALAEALRKKIEEIPFEIRREEMNVTLSIGICQIHPSDTTKDHLLHRADQALYEAKRMGKNRVCQN